MAASIARLIARGEGAGQPDISFEFAADTIRRAEELGFGVTLLAERLMGPDLEAWILATAIAMRTRTIELMVAVHPGIVPPAMVAKMGASLDRVSGGRLSLNLIAGWWDAEMNLFGNGAWIADPNLRARRLSEYIDVLNGLWCEERFGYQGDFFSVPEGTHLPIRPVQTPRPRFYAAARAAAGKEMVARTCDTWFAEYQADYRAYEENIAQISAEVSEMGERAALAGRKLGFGLSAHVIVADTREDAIRQANELEAYGRTDRVAFTAAKALGAGLIGTAETVAERIRRYEALGIDCLMLRFHPMEAGLERFGAEVMPRLGRSGPERAS